ncbi:MAG TPA: NAD(P)-dependent oxidoreductase [Chthoniobacteraceae bacterium]|nr:NAD(P)-dependent oxidoreductase [Chthoniobacteraceae bacterium]
MSQTSAVVEPGPVTITGAAGEVGRRVVPFLCQKHPLRLTDLRPGTIEGMEVVPNDLLDLDATLRVLEGSRAVVHLAIADYTGVNDQSPEELQAPYRRRMLDVNITGAYHIFEAARILKIPRVVYMSSLTVMFGSPAPNRREIDRPQTPLNFYACTKAFGENLAWVYHQRYGIEAYVLRLGQPFPRGVPQEEEWKKSPRSASNFTTFADIARSIDAALKVQEPAYGVFNVVSRSSFGHVDLSAGKGFGFEPEDLVDDLL